MTELAHNAESALPAGFAEAEMILLRRYQMDPIFHAKVVSYQHVHGDFSGKVTLDVLDKVARLTMAWFLLRAAPLDGVTPAGCNAAPPIGLEGQRCVLRGPHHWHRWEAQSDGVADRGPDD